MTKSFKKYYYYYHYYYYYSKSLTTRILPKNLTSSRILQQESYRRSLLKEAYQKKPNKTG